MVLGVSRLSAASSSLTLCSIAWYKIWLTFYWHLGATQTQRGLSAASSSLTRCSGDWYTVLLASCWHLGATQTQRGLLTASSYLNRCYGAWCIFYMTFYWHLGVPRIKTHQCRCLQNGQSPHTFGLQQSPPSIDASYVFFYQNSSIARSLTGFASCEVALLITYGSILFVKRVSYNQMDSWSC